MYEFKRKEKKTYILFGLAIALALLTIFTPVSGTFEIVLTVIAVICLITGIAFRLLKPDYRYIIMVTDNDLIFEFNETDHRPISRKFTAHIKKDTILLTYAPTDTRISVPYDDEVKDFLKKAMK